MSDNKEFIPMVTPEELTRVEHNMLNADQLKYLLQRTPKDHLSERKAKGGGMWTYVTGTYVKKVLNLMFGWDWSFEIVEHNIDLIIKQCYVLGKLTINSGGKTIVKMQFGRADIKYLANWEKGVKVVTDQPLDVGNDLKAAATDALKKCASEIGVASDVYGKNEFKEISIVTEDKRSTVEKDRVLSFISKADSLVALRSIKSKISQELFVEIESDYEERENQIMYDEAIKEKL